MLLNIDSYFRRIRYDGPVENDATTLSAVVLAHATAIPFENLSALSGEAIRLDLDSIVEKIVHQGRGGYCFEQNNLLAHALRQLGFDVRMLSARVWFNNPSDDTPPRTHLFLEVTVAGKRWLVDCGIGGTTPTAPLDLDLLDEVQPTPHEPRRLIRCADRSIPTYMHQADMGDRWADLCEFTGESMPMADQQMANWWTSGNRTSKFRTNLIVSIAGADGTRFSILNQEFTHRRGPTVLERCQLTSREELGRRLADHFNLSVPPSCDLAAVGFD